MPLAGAAMLFDIVVAVLKGAKALGSALLSEPFQVLLAFRMVRMLWESTMSDPIRTVVLVLAGALAVYLCIVAISALRRGRTRA